MPFISKDWRSPGEQWVKTRQGWEKKKVLECIDADEWAYGNSKCLDWLSEDKENVDAKKRLNGGGKVQPYCQITIKSTREVAGFNALSDVLKRLDWRSAMRDRRRFTYITKLLSLLVSEQPLARLSGNVQKVVFTMLEEVANQLCSSGENPEVLRKLEAQAQSLVESAVWGHPLGSTQLWNQHLQTIRRVSDLTRSFSAPTSEVELTERLPAEVVTEVVRRLADPADVESALEVLGPYLLSGEDSLWHALVRFHFTPEQIASVPHNSAPSQLFYALKKKYGLREEYADSVRLCKDCSSLFWASSGHPCLPGRSQSIHVSLSPHAFLTFFSL